MEKKGPGSCFKPYPNRNRLLGGDNQRRSHTRDQDAVRDVPLQLLQHNATTLNILNGPQLCAAGATNAFMCPTADGLGDKLEIRNAPPTIEVSTPDVPDAGLRDLDHCKFPRE
jgi:hypothetical protein